jgi:phosphoenolpyruvate carboxylase
VFTKNENELTVVEKVILQNLLEISYQKYVDFKKSRDVLALFRKE